MTNTGKIIIAIMLLVIVALGYLLFRSAGQGNSNVTPTVTPTAEVSETITPTEEEPAATSTPAAATAAPTSTGNVVTTPPAGWKPLVNDGQGYTAYRPNGWYYRFFPPNFQTLGIDPSPIPDASSYAGAVSIRRLGSTNEYTEFKNGLTAGYSTSTVTYNGHEWTIIEGTIPANEISGLMYVKAGYVKVGSKEFLAQLQSGAANYGGFEDEFDIFVSTIVFN